jgi:DNA primase
MLGFDGDGAGRKAAVKAARLLLEADMPVRAARMPPGEDPDSLIRSNGAKAMKDVLSSSTTIAAFLAESLLSSKEDDHLSDDERKMWAAKETLELIGHCRSAVMRESLMEETARITGFTVEALRSDLSRQKPVANEKDVMPQPSPLPVPPKIEIASASSIPLAERCLCLLLIENEGNEAMTESVRRILSTKRLTDFTQSIIRVWLGGNDFAAAHAESQSSTRTELERLLVARRTDYLPHLSPERIVQDFERILPPVA